MASPIGSLGECANEIFQCMTGHSVSWWVQDRVTVYVAEDGRARTVLIAGGN